MFLGIQENDAPFDAESETENNNVENTKEVIYNFLQKELSLENAVSRFEFQRIHRVGKRSGKKPRPIIAIQDFSDIPIGQKSYYVQRLHSKGKIMVFLFLKSRFILPSSILGPNELLVTYQPGVIWRKQTLRKCSKTSHVVQEKWRRDCGLLLISIPFPGGFFCSLVKGKLCLCTSLVIS